MQQQIDHVSHVCFIFRPENLPAAMDQFGKVFGVADLKAAAERARALGVAMHEDEHGAPMIIDGMRAIDGGPAHPSWPTRLRRYQEVSLKPLCGLNFYLGQIEPL